MMVGLVVLSAVSVAAKQSCTDKHGKAKKSCMPATHDSVLPADTTTVATPPTPVSALNTATPWRDSSAPDVLIDGFDTAPTLEGVPGLYWDGMSYSDIVIEKRNAEILAESLRNNGEFKMPGDAAHHIVESTRPIADDSRRKLQSFGLDINSVDNGVWLPHKNRSGSRVYHGDTYEGDYTRWVESRIKTASTRDEALVVLSSIKNALINGEMPWKNSTK